jgi:endonuclease/exonuclease/phosphatase family metal-dependent hydrolase
MSSRPVRSLRRRSLLMVVALLVAMLPPGVAVAGGSPQLTVLTQNLYLGTRLDNVFAASTPTDLVAAMSQDWANVLANDFPTRAAALADEITRVRPDVLGLQEVTLWRDQAPSDFRSSAVPNAARVAVDHLAILRRELSARGVPYTAVATSTNADIEAPRLGPGGSLVDVRVTDRDVLLVRADRAEQAHNPRHGHYTAQFQQPFLTGPVPSTRGWASADVRLDARTTVRIITTHLEIAAAGGIQERQGAEALTVVAASPYPVIVLGDINSAPDDTITDTYRRLTAVLDDAWAAARPGDAGATCCQDELLGDGGGRESRRIDVVLTSEDWPVTRVARTGDEPFRAGPPPRWASDHVGVMARIAVRCH